MAPGDRALRSLAGALTAAVETGTDEDLARLAQLDPTQVRTVTGAVVRDLLEQLHPDGLSGDDVAAVLRSVQVDDPQVLLLVLTGALGLLDADDQPATLTPEVAVRYSVALIAGLLATARSPLQPWLETALAERHRAETVEMP